LIRCNLIARLADLAPIEWRILDSILHLKQSNPLDTLLNVPIARTWQQLTQ
jgi:hypothetical protein